MEDFLDTLTLAKRWKISPRTLERWRWEGIGTKYIKIGGGVFYIEQTTFLRLKKKEKTNMTAPHIDIDDCVQRYIAAFDEIAYIAEQLGAHMGIAPHYEISKDYLNAMIEKAEDLVMDLENVRDDADGDNHE